MERPVTSAPTTFADRATALGQQTASTAVLATIGARLRMTVSHFIQVYQLAIARGVFGAPFIFIDGEPFWGADRLPQIERWLAHGAF